MAGLERQPFRADIQGLRAIAVGFVVLYHASLPGLTGGYVGVDIFFVISGFLITNHLLANLLRDGRIDFASFYAKRARRILPASLVVLLLTLASAAIWIAPLDLKATFQDAIATVAYAPNLLFAYQNTDYLADQAPSLFQHYWSLGVEEQFYIVWPAIMAIGFLAFGKSRSRLFWGLMTLVVLSFVGGMVLTTVAQPWAFFSLPTRAWELGVGGLVAFAVSSPKWRPSQTLARVGGWAGIVALAAIGFLYNDATVFPGTAAAGPVLATAAVIYFGHWRTRGDPGVILNRRGLVFVGTISYSLYLLHWPALVIPAKAGGLENELTLWSSLAIAFICVPLAWVLYRYVERPAQNWHLLTTARPRLTLLATAGASVVIVAICATGIYASSRLPLSTEQSASGASYSAPPVFTSFVPENLTPSLYAAAASNPAIYATECHVNEAAVIAKGCEFGDNPTAPEVQLFGDSHAAQWFPALYELAAAGDIQLRVDTKSSCPSVDIPKLEDGLPYLACETWRDNVQDQIDRTQPDIIVLANYARSPGFSDGPEHPDEWKNGLISTMSEFPKAADVYVIADSPNLPTTPAVCLSAHLSEARACGVSRDEAIDEEINAAEAQAAATVGGTFVDLTNFICSAERCDPITGNLLIFRDGNHLTPQFSAGLADELADELDLQLR